MSYKGNDLDLRGTSVASLRDNGTEDAGMPGAWPPHPDIVRDMGHDGGRDMVRDGGRDMGRDAPISVDQTVMEVSNAAYDAAAFHGARDVGLPHLVYALTRVEPAREVLEMHGVRTAELRRDAAAAIAETEPGAGPGSRVPRSSVELENVLRRAASRAGQDSVPASVHDVLRVLVTYGRETPATVLLLGAAADPDQLQRWAAEPVPGPQPGPGAALREPGVVLQLMGRLDAMEHRIGALVADVAADRKALLDLVAEIQQEMRARPVPSHAENSAAIATIADRLEETNRAVAQLGERFEAIRAFSPEENADLGGRLSALEGRLAEQPAAIAHAVNIMLGERKSDAEPSPQPPPDTEHMGALGERLSSVEDLLRGQTERMQEAAKLQERDLGEIFEALVKLGTNQQTLASNLEAWRLDSSGDISIVSNRLERLERAVAPQPAPPRPKPAVAQSNTGEPREKTIKRWRVLPATWREDAAALRDSLRRPAKT